MLEVQVQPAPFLGRSVFSFIFYTCEIYQYSDEGLSKLGFKTLILYACTEESVLLFCSPRISLLHQQILLLVLEQYVRKTTGLSFDLNPKIVLQTKKPHTHTLKEVRFRKEEESCATKRSGRWYLPSHVYASREEEFCAPLRKTPHSAGRPRDDKFEKGRRRAETETARRKPSSWSADSLELSA